MALRPFVWAGLMLSLLLIQPPAAPSAPEGKRPPWELARAKVDAAHRTCKALAEEFLEGKTSVDQIHQWSQRMLNAQLEASKKKEEQTTAREDHITRMQQLEQLAQKRFEKGKGLASDLSAAEYYRLDAELALSKFKTSK
jgi:hypothetical protein